MQRFWLATECDVSIYVCNVGTTRLMYKGVYTYLYMKSPDCKLERTFRNTHLGIVGADSTYSIEYTVLHTYLFLFSGVLYATEWQAPYYQNIFIHSNCFNFNKVAQRSKLLEYWIEIIHLFHCNWTKNTLYPSIYYYIYA